VGLLEVEGKVKGAEMEGEAKEREAGGEPVLGVEGEVNMLFGSQIGAGVVCVLGGCRRKWGRKSLGSRPLPELTKRKIVREGFERQ
jgi:hypothetical protein